MKNIYIYFPGYSIVSQIFAKNFKYLWSIYDMLTIITIHSIFLTKILSLKYPAINFRLGRLFPSRRFNHVLCLQYT